ncbi:MAG: hypothetical protein PVI21_01830 [Candidatus Woesebacteria bacterium]|jgi:hypothetical protein
MTSFRRSSTIQELATYYKNKIAQYNKNLSTRQKEQLAWHLTACDSVDGWEKWCVEYPTLEDAYCLASDLSWSNSLEIDRDWQELIKYINLFDKQVNNKDHDNES